MAPKHGVFRQCGAHDVGQGEHEDEAEVEDGPLVEVDDAERPDLRCTRRFL